MIDCQRFLILLFLWGSVLLPIFVFGQSYTLFQYQTDQGLPTNLTKASVKDSIGFIWVATDEGICRFDGQVFTQYKDLLPSNYTKSLYTSKSYGLLVINDLGILQVKPQLDTVHFEILLEGEGDVETPDKVIYPKEVFEDKQGNLWISEPQSLLRWQNGQTKRYTFPEKMRTTVYLRSFHMAEMPNGALFTSAFPGFLMRYSPQKDEFQTLDLGNTNLSDISFLHPYNDTTLWIGAREGLFALTIDSLANIRDIQEILKLRSLSSYCRQRNGNYILGTWKSGIYQYNPLVNPESAQNIPESGSSVINHVQIDEENNIWASTDEGLELLQQNLFESVPLQNDRTYIEALWYSARFGLLLSNGTDVYKISEVLPQTKIDKIFNYQKSNILSLCSFEDKIFFGTGDNRLLEFSEGSLQNDRNLSAFGKSIFSVLADRRGNIWICQYGNELGVLKMNADRELKEYEEGDGIQSMISVVRESPGGNLYAGGHGTNSYLYRYNPAVDRFINISRALPIDNTLDLVINDLYPDNQGQIWLASNQGLWKMGGKKQIQKLNLGPKYTHLNMKSVYLDPKGFLWIGTDLGIIKYKDKQFVFFDKSDGLSNVTSTLRGIALAYPRTLFFGSAQGVHYLIDPGNTIQKTPSPSLISFRANGIKQDFNTRFHVEYQSNLDIRFLSFTYPYNNIRYQYRILGLDSAWSGHSQGNRIIEQRIPYGNYILEIRANRFGNYTWSPPPVYPS